MRRTEGAYPVPTHGLSTLDKLSRLDGQAEDQLNMRSDPVKKLTRSPSIQFGKRLLISNEGEIKVHTFQWKGQNYRIIVTDAGTIHCYIDDEEKPVVGNISGYISAAKNMEMKTVNSRTYLTDTTRVTELVQDVPDIIEKVVHLNIIEAMNYNETMEIVVRKSDASEHIVTYTIPDIVGSDTNDADEARATNRVAQEIAARINSGGTHVNLVPNKFYTGDPTFCDEYNSGGLNPLYDPSDPVCIPYIDQLYAGIPGVTALALGSCVAIWQNDGEWLEVEVATGQGSRSGIAVNQVVESVEGIPLYAIHGTRVTVKPDPRTEKGTYYVEAVGVAPGAIQAPFPADRKMEEVTWVESRSPGELHRIQRSTMPHRIEYVEASDTFVVTTVGWQDRLTGDNKSNKVPGFIGKTISDIELVQNRLVLVAGAECYLSEVDNQWNFWIRSAVQLLVSDRVGVASSATNTDNIRYAVPHNRDMLFIASNAQFKLSGEVPVTPQTASMPMTTRNQVQLDTRPVGMGNAVYIPVNFGESSGILKYTGEQATLRDTSNVITHHITGLLKGKITHLSASPNFEMLVVRTDQTEDREFYVFEQFRTVKGEVLQQSWSRWQIPDAYECVIKDIRFNDDRIELITEDFSLLDDTYSLNVKYINLYEQTERVYLSDKLTFASDGVSVTLPEGYPISFSIRVVGGEDSEYPYFSLPFEVMGNQLVLDTPQAPCTLYVGMPYRSSYKPTRPFIRDAEGVPIITDRLNIRQINLEVVETAEVRMSVDYKFAEIEDQVYEVGYVFDENNQLGEQGFLTGTVNFSYGHEAGEAQVEFYTENHLGLTISGINWSGDYKQSAGRV